MRNQQRYCRKGWMLCGSRVILSERQTKKVLSSGWQKLSTWQKVWMRGLKGLYFPLFSGLFSKHIRGIYGLRGCINSYWKEDAQAINGYNEAYIGWGREDNDFFARMQQQGIQIKKLKLAGHWLPPPPQARQSQSTTPKRCTSCRERSKKSSPAAKKGSSCTSCRPSRRKSLRVLTSFQKRKVVTL